MKRFMLAMIMVVGSLAVFSATGNAQVTRRYSANIPFDFSVGKKQFKAGDYTVGPIGAQTNSDFLALTDRSTGKVQLIGQVSVNKYETDLSGKLEFANSDNGWVLRSIETGTFSAKFGGKNLDASKIASNRGAPVTRSVAAQ